MTTEHLWGLVSDCFLVLLSHPGKSHPFLCCVLSSFLHVHDSVLLKKCLTVFVFLCWSKTKEASVHALMLMIKNRDIFDHEYTKKKKTQTASVHIKVIILKPWNTNKWHIIKSAIIHASLESQLINTDTNVQYSANKGNIEISETASHYSTEDIQNIKECLKHLNIIWAIECPF